MGKRKNQIDTETMTEIEREYSDDTKKGVLLHLLNSAVQC
jgi:hypothetical protein